MTTHSPSTTPRHAAPHRRARRGLTAAGALSLALSGGAFALAGMSTADAAASASLNYTCTLTNFNSTYNDPWVVTLTADLPASLKPGESIPAPAISAVVVTGKDASDQIHQLNIKAVEGSAKAGYTIGGQAATAGLDIAKTTVPDSGSLTTRATGTGQAFTAPSTAGPLEVKATDFTSDLTTDTGFVIHLACTPAKGSSTTIGTIQVAAQTTSAPATTTAPTTSTSEPTAPTTTSTSTSPATATATSKSSAPTTAEPTTSSTASTTSSTATTPSTTSTTSATAPTSSTSSTTTTAGPSTTSTAAATTGSATSTDASMTSDSSTTTNPPAPASTAPVGSAAPAQGPMVQTDHTSSTNVASLVFAALGVAALAGAAVTRQQSN